MATVPLLPAAAPANSERAAFNLALAHCAAASDARDALPSSATIAAEIAAGEAIERAQAQLAATIAPDAAALVTKLRLTLAAAGTPAGLIEALTRDVRGLARKVEALA